MAKRYQILTRDKRGEQWKFVAHGARYEAEEAQAMADLMKARGALVRLIAI